MNLERLHVINAAVVLITVCLYWGNKAAVTSTIHGVVNYGTNYGANHNHAFII